MLSASLLLLASLQTQAKLSLDLSVTSVGQVLEAVSKQTGQKYSVSGAVQNDFVFVSVKDVEPEVFLNRLADLLDAKWLSGNGVRTLTAPDNLLNEADQNYRDHVKKWAADLAKGLAKPMDIEFLAKSLAGMKNKGNGESEYDWDKLREIDEDLPTGRFASTIVIRLISELSQIKNGERVVFSFQPTRLQQPLPTSLRSDFDEFGRSYLRCREALVRHNVIGDNEDYMGDGPQNFSEPEPPKQFIVTATRTNEFLTVLVRFFDETGYFNIDLTKGMWGQLELDESAEDAVGPFKDLTKEVKVTPKMLEYAPLISSGGAVKPGSKTTPPTREEVLRLISIDKNEPLASTPGEVLKQYASAVGKNVLAYVPDSALYSIYSVPGEGSNGVLTLASMMPQVLRIGYVGKFQLKVEDKDGIQTLRDTSLTQARLERMPRLASATLFRALHAKQKFDLDSIADFLQKNKSDECLSVVSEFASFAAGLEVTLPENDELKVLKFYADFNQGARDQIKKSEIKLNPSTLTTKQKEIFAHFLYKADSAISDTDEMSEEVDVKFGFPEMDRYSMGVGSVKEDPTFKLANGLPPNTFVRMSMISRESIFEKTEFDEYTMKEATSPQTIAYQLVYKEKGISDDYYGRPRKYMMGPSTKLELDINLPSYGEIQKKYMLDEIKSNGGWIDFSELPEPVRKEVEKHLQRVREQLKNLPVGGGGRTVKPPVKNY